MNKQDFVAGGASSGPGEQVGAPFREWDGGTAVAPASRAPSVIDPDWDEACRIAERLGFGQDAVTARKRARKPQRPAARPPLSPREAESWNQQERRLIGLLNQRAWKKLATALTDLARQPHPFDHTSVQQLHYLACTLAGGDWPVLPEEDRHEGGTLLQALADLTRLLQLALEEDLEWAFDQGLADLSPYLVGDRATELQLLNPYPLAAEGLVEAVLERLGERFDLEQRVGPRFRAARLYFRLRQLPSLRVSEQEFLALREAAGGQAFFLSFLGRQGLVHWRHAPDSIRNALEHLWVAYRQECEYTEEPSIVMELAGLQPVAEADAEAFREALSRGVDYLAHKVADTLAGQRFLRHVWRKYLVQYQSVLARMEEPGCLDLLIRIRASLADEIEPELEFLIACLASKLRRWHLVEESYLRGLALDPDNLDETLNLASFYKSRSRYVEARGLLSKVLRLKPGDPFLLRRLRAVADRQDLQNQQSPYLTPLPDAKALPTRELELLGNLELLSFAAMVSGLQFDDSGHLRAFAEAERAVFPHDGIRDRVVRELLTSHALLVYRYSQEQSYRVQGLLFDFDMDRVEWVSNAHSVTYPDLPPEVAALRLLRDRLTVDPASLTSLWRQVAGHDLLCYTQHCFRQQGWYLDSSDYLLETMDSLLLHLPFKQALVLVDLAITATREDLAARRVGVRQAGQRAIRHLQSSYEKAILREIELAEEVRVLESESLWTRLFRMDLVQLGSLYYQMVPGEVMFAR